MALVWTLQEAEFEHIQNGRKLEASSRGDTAKEGIRVERCRAYLGTGELPILGKPLICVKGHDGKKADTEQWDIRL